MRRELGEVPVNAGHQKGKFEAGCERSKLNKTVDEKIQFPKESPVLAALNSKFGRRNFGCSLLLLPELSELLVELAKVQAQFRPNSATVNIRDKIHIMQLTGK